MLTPSIAPEYNSIAFNWLMSIVPNKGFAQSILAILIIFLTALIINQSIKHARLTNPYSLFGGLFYIILMSIHPDFLGLHPIQFSNLFIATAIYFIILTYKKHSAFGAIFNAGLCLSMGILFYFPNVFFILAGLAGIIVIRSFKLKERIVWVLGLLCPFYLLGHYWFVTDRIAEVSTKTFGIELIENLNFALIKNPHQLLGLVIFGILILFISTQSYALGSKKSIISRKSIQVIYWFLLMTIPGIFLISSPTVIYFQMCCIMLAVGLGVSIFSWKNKALAEVFHLFLFASILLFHFSEDIINLIK